MDLNQMTMIECVGVDGEKKVFSKEHTKYRMVHTADAPNVKRCVACQKARAIDRSWERRFEKESLGDWAGYDEYPGEEG